jgi:hypothetical protein
LRLFFANLSGRACLDHETLACPQLFVGRARRRPAAIIEVELFLTQCAASFSRHCDALSDIAGDILRLRARH